ncbi:ribonuclease H-like domain-containing protein [Tanacetum coccineum]
MFPFKTITTSDPSQDLNHSNFFDNLDVEIPDTPCDEERIVNIPNSNGSNSSQVGSPTIDQHENVEIHFFGSNGSITGSEMAATLEDNHNNYEGDDGNIQNIKTDQITQPVRRYERSLIFPNKYNNFVVDSKVKYSLEKYVNYLKLNSKNKCFVTELNKSVKPKNYWEACKDQHWVEAMNKEMDALYKNDTWEITDLPLGRKSIGGKWVYKIKYKSNGEIERYKARYVVKGYNQKEGVDFDETFSLVVKIITTVYMDLPEGYFSPKDKRFLKTEFEIKDLGKLKYFSGIEVLEINQGLCLSQKKYCLDLLSEFGMLACKPSATPLERNLAIIHCLSQFMHKPLRSHIKIALKVLRYLKSNHGKGIHIVKQPKASLEAFVHAKWAKCLATRKSVTGFCVKLNGSLVS